MNNPTFKVTQKDGTVLIYKPRSDFDFYSVVHFTPRTDNARLIKQLPTNEALNLLESYKIQKDVKLTVR